VNGYPFAIGQIGQAPTDNPIKLAFFIIF